MANFMQPGPSNSDVILEINEGNVVYDAEKGKKVETEKEYYERIKEEEEKTREDGENKMMELKVNIENELQSIIDAKDFNNTETNYISESDKKELEELTSLYDDIFGENIDFSNLKLVEKFEIEKIREIFLKILLEQKIEKTDSYGELFSLCENNITLENKITFLLETKKLLDNYKNNLINYLSEEIKKSMFRAKPYTSGHEYSELEERQNYLENIKDEAQDKYIEEAKNFIKILNSYKNSCESVNIPSIKDIGKYILDFLKGILNKVNKE